MSADIIINPIRLKNYPYGGFTAGLVEAIRHAKLGIYPARFQILEELTSSSLFYNKIEELPDLIKNLLDNRELLQVTDKEGREKDILIEELYKQIGQLKVELDWL